ncbi:MAG: hypothetical protein M0R32_10255 [Candidatus Cloacimonetes bacterium]|jgi:hypothetical protein|nr:hypothetical protein [Candidatus Cloacimonadota bacterium]
MQTWYKKVLAQNVPVSKGSPFYIPQKQIGPSELDRQIDREIFEKREKTMMSELKTCVFRYFADLNLNRQNPKIDFKASYKTDKAIASLEAFIRFNDTPGQVLFNDKYKILDIEIRLASMVNYLQKELQEISGSATKPKVNILFNGKSVGLPDTSEAPSEAYFSISSLNQLLSIKHNGLKFDGKNPIVFYSRKAGGSEIMLKILNPSAYKNWKLDRSPEVGVFYGLKESISPSDLAVCSKKTDKGVSIKFLDTEDDYGRAKDIKDGWNIENGWIAFDSLDKMRDSDLRSLFVMQSDNYKLFYPSEYESGGWGENKWYRDKRFEELNKRRMDIEKSIGNGYPQEHNPIIMMYYGLLGTPRMSFYQIANLLNATPKEIEKLLTYTIRELPPKGKKNLRKLLHSQDSPK